MNAIRLRQSRSLARQFWPCVLASAVLLTAGCHSLKWNSTSCDSPGYNSGQGDEIAGVALCGCFERSADFGQAAVPAPPGTYVNVWNDAMICSARRHDFVIARHEWFSGGGQLGPEGRQHVTRLADVMAAGSQNVIVEAEPTELRSEESLDEALARTSGLNEQRRNDVVAILAKHGILDADQRVLMAPIDRVGTRGVEAPQVYNQLLQGGIGRGGQFGGRGGAGGGQNFGGGGGGGGFY